MFSEGNISLQCNGFNEKIEYADAIEDEDASENDENDEFDVDQEIPLVLEQ